MGEFASKGVAEAGLGLGIAGTALGVLNGGWGNLLGGYGRNYGGYGKCGYGYGFYSCKICSNCRQDPDNESKTATWGGENTNISKDTCPEYTG